MIKSTINAVFYDVPIYKHAKQLIENKMSFCCLCKHADKNSDVMMGKYFFLLSQSLSNLIIDWENRSSVQQIVTKTKLLTETSMKNDI